MTIEKVYKEHKHLNHLLSDKEWLPHTQTGRILYDLWQAIKEKCEKK